MRIGFEAHELRHGRRHVAQPELAVCDLAVRVVDDEGDGVEAVRGADADDAFFVLFQHLIRVAVVGGDDEGVTLLFHDGQQTSEPEIDCLHAYPGRVEVAGVPDHSWDSCSG